MKTISASLTSHYESLETTIATAIRITRTDGEVYGFTTHDVDDTIGAVTYSSNPGLIVTDVVTSANSAVGNLQLTTLHDGTIFTNFDIFSGVWRNAAFTIFRYNWANVSASPDDGIDTLLVGTFGEVELKLNTVVIELRDLRQYLQHSVGSASSKTCRYRLGDDKCGIVLGGSPSTAWTKTGTVTSVVDNQEFRDSSRAEAADFFGEGELTFLDGPNAGIRMKIKAYAANGTFTLALPLYGTVAIGQTYTAIAGCRKRLAEDCVAKFANVLNFGGEPHRKGINDLTQTPT